MAISLGVVSGGFLMRDEVGLEEGANGLVEEVTTLFTNEFQGAPKASDDIFIQKLCRYCSGVRLQRFGFHPLGCIIGGDKNVPGAFKLT